MKRFFLSVLITSMFAVQASHGQESDQLRRLPDMSKTRIESPVKTLLLTPEALKSESLTRMEVSKKEPKKKVKPGAVTWYPTTALAKKNSLLSGKPVLIFHLMGFLDDRFC